jgi:DNA-directed RNA polymerase alpha subunit
MKRKAREKMRTLKWEIEELDKRVDLLTTEIHVAKFDLRRKRGEINEDRLQAEKTVYELSTRARRGLIDCGVRMVCDIELITPAYLVRAWGVGKKTFDEIINWMKKNDLKFKEKESEYEKD